MSILKLGHLPTFRIPTRESKLAEEAALLVREAPFPSVNKLAGDRAVSIRTILRLIDSASDAAEVAGQLHPPERRAAARAVAQRRELKPDRAYFTANVDPILHAKRKDVYACRRLSSHSHALQRQIE